MSDTDIQLLARYVRHHAEDAFAEIVQRHLGLVYSAALRQVRSPQLAEEVAQSVFTSLAREAERLRPNTLLTAWLYQVTRHTAANVVRGEIRRQLREQTASEMNAMNATAADWTHIEPLLDEAMHELDDTDRAAVLLRYFENKSLRDVGQALGASENAAQKRLTRAVEQLRDFFGKRDVSVGASGLVVVISANAVQAAPVGLAVTISTATALAGTSFVTSTLTTATKSIAMTSMQKSLFAAALTVAVGAGIYEARHASTLQSQIQMLRQESAAQVQQLQQERAEAIRKLVAAGEETRRLGQEATDVLKLRAEVARLRSEAQQRAQLKSDSSDGSIESVAKSWVDRVARLKQRLEQTRQAVIPELQLLDEEDWLAVVKGRPLDTDTDYRRAMSAVRGAGEGKFASLMQEAVRRFKRNNNDRFPTDLVQLQPYFDSQIDAAILDRWRIASGQTVPSVGVGEIIITQKAPPVDEVFDVRLVVGSDGGSGSTDFLPPEHWAAMKPLYEAYRAEHNGQWHTDFSELQPYATTPEQQLALQKMILRSSSPK